VSDGDKVWTSPASVDNPDARIGTALAIADDEQPAVVQSP